LIDIGVVPNAATFSFTLNRDELRGTRRREGRYLLRTNLCGREPAAPNSIEHSSAFHRTYAPVDEVAARTSMQLDCAVGGTSRREQNGAKSLIRDRQRDGAIEERLSD
jgi:hypothetical protein